MYDTTEIKRRITCVEVAQRSGLPITRSGDRCVSPLRPGAKNPSSFSVDDEYWYDFGSGAGGDAIDLHALLNCNGDRGQAIRELARLTGVHNNNTTNPDGWFKYTEQLNNKISYWQTRLTDSDREYLHSRGLADATIASLRLGRDTDGRLSIPYIKNGYVAYYCTRYLDGGKYPDSKYRKAKRDDFNQHVVYGLDTLKQQGDTLIIAEGAFDAFSFIQDGYPCISAITGYFSHEQIPTVLSACRKFKRVFMVYDNDTQSHAGEHFTQRMAELLIRNRIPFVVGTVPPVFHDVSEYYAAGGKLQQLVDTAEQGVIYVAKSLPDYAAFEKFCYNIARFTARDDLDDLFLAIKKLDKYPENRLKNLYKTCTTAPPENIITDELIQKYQIIYIHAVGFYEYKQTQGYWQPITDDTVRAYADKLYGTFTNYQRVNAVCNMLRVRVSADVEFDRQPVWNFINGTLELDTGNFREHNPNDYCSLRAEYPYDPDAKCPSWQKFITEVTSDDPIAAEILQFIPAYALFPNCQHEKIFVLSGEGGNGKTQYLKILNRLFGNTKTTYLQPRALLDKFQLIQLKNSIINIAGEIKSDVHDAEEIMKMIASGEPITACFKGKDFITFTSRTKLIYACNNMLASGDTSEGLTRRLIMVDFKTSFVDDPDPADPYQRRKDINLYSRLAAEVDSGAVFNWVYQGYKLLKQVGYFSETYDQLHLLHEFKRASNPVLVFFEEYFIEQNITEISNEQLYITYENWCKASGFKPMDIRRFGREFNRVAKKKYERFVRKVNGKTIRGYRLPVENTPENTPGIHWNYIPPEI